MVYDPEDDGYDWRDDAACPAYDPELWFPTSGGQKLRKAREICDGCPVKRECFEYAVNNPAIDTGIWGGVSGREPNGYMTERKRRGIGEPWRYQKRGPRGAANPV